MTFVFLLSLPGSWKKSSRPSPPRRARVAPGSLGPTQDQEAPDAWWEGRVPSLQASPGGSLPHRNSFCRPNSPFIPNLDTDLVNLSLVKGETNQLECPKISKAIPKLALTAKIWQLLRMIPSSNGHRYYNWQPLLFSLVTFLTWPINSLFTSHICWCTRGRPVHGSSPQCSPWTRRRLPAYVPRIPGTLPANRKEFNFVLSWGDSLPEDVAGF